MKNKIRSNYIYLIFLIPIIPHFETSFRFLHTDDIPIVLYFIAFFIFENKKNVLSKVRKFLPITLFTSYLLIQNLGLRRDEVNVWNSSDGWPKGSFQSSDRGFKKVGV